MPIRRRRVQNAAEDILEAHRITSPPVPIERLAKSLGARLRHEALKGGLSGFLYREGNSAIIGINTHHSPARQRFTIAHEMGHLVLHQQRSVRVDHEFQLRLRSDLSSQGTNQEEMEANLFAAEILMPKSLIERDLGTIETVDLLDSRAIEALSKKYGVSVQALLIRLAALGYINQ